MAKRKFFCMLFPLTLAAGSLASAQAQDVHSTLNDLAQTTQPFHSRTCGLVLLSDGRKQVRAVKASDGQGDYALATAQLVKAFLLLRDGREQTHIDAQAPRDYFAKRLSTGEATHPRYQALPDATAHCERWYETRLKQPDFDRGEEAQWSALEQAELTLKTELLPR